MATATATSEKVEVTCGRCKTCKFWKRRDPTAEGVIAPKECMHQKIVYGVANDFDDGAFLVEEGAVLVDVQLGTGFHPGPEFGCVLHEEDDDAENQTD